MALITLKGNEHSILGNLPCFLLQSFPPACGCHGDGIKPLALRTIIRVVCRLKAQPKEQRLETEGSLQSEDSRRETTQNRISHLQVRNVS